MSVMDSTQFILKPHGIWAYMGQKGKLPIQSCYRWGDVGEMFGEMLTIRKLVTCIKFNIKKQVNCKNWTLVVMTTVPFYYCSTDGLILLFDKLD